MRKYQVIEDNGGGLTLVVFGSVDKVEYIHSGYECSKGQLTDDLQGLSNGDNPLTDWDGNEGDPQSSYDDFFSHVYGWKIVADNDGVYPEKMGAAARREFNIKA